MFNLSLGPVVRFRSPGGPCGHCSWWAQTQRLREPDQRDLQQRHMQTSAYECEWYPAPLHMALVADLEIKVSDHCSIRPMEIVLGTDRSTNHDFYGKPKTASAIRQEPCFILIGNLWGLWSLAGMTRDSRGCSRTQSPLQHLPKLFNAYQTTCTHYGEPEQSCASIS